MIKVYKYQDDILETSKTSEIKINEWKQRYFSTSEVVFDIDLLNKEELVKKFNIAKFLRVEKGRGDYFDL